MKQLIVILGLLTCISAKSQEIPRWELAENGGITWTINDRIPHNDHIEMSGKQLSVVLRYGVNNNGAFVLERSIVWPMLRFQPNNTHEHLNRRFALNVLDLIAVNKVSPKREKVQKITLDGAMTVESSLSNELHLTRILFPSTSRAAYLEQYVLSNIGEKNINIELPDVDMTYSTEASTGIYGEYQYEVKMTKKGFYVLNPGKELSFTVSFSARKSNENVPVFDVAKELASDRKSTRLNSSH